MEKIENISLAYLTVEDYQDLKDAMIESYSTMPNQYWREAQIKSLIEKFPEGQVVIKVNDQIAGCASSLIIEEEKFERSHTYKEITGNYSFRTHNGDGNIFYGIELFIVPEFRGLRLGRRLYDYRKELCENLNLKGIVF